MNGLYTKFEVRRVDGRDSPGGDREKARYFVLDYVHDSFARAALAEYAEACFDDYPQLAADLVDELERTREEWERHVFGSQGVNR